MISHLQFDDLIVTIKNVQNILRKVIFNDTNIVTFIILMFDKCFYIKY